MALRGVLIKTEDMHTDCIYSLANHKFDDNRYV